MVWFASETREMRLTPVMMRRRQYGRMISWVWSGSLLGWMPKLMAVNATPGSAR